MNAITQRRRLAAAAVSLAVVAGPVAAGAFSAAGAAAPARTAATSVDTTYLTDTFPGLPATNILETVTYDRFQWLLQQNGQFAFVIGSASDSGFAAKVVQTEAAARAAGAKKVYWFDPNLTGQTGQNKNLDTRNPSGINLAAASQTVYGNTWRNLVGQYLGNGVKAVPNATATSVTTTNDDTVVNDAVDPLWDLRTTPAAAPVAANEDVFFVYDRQGVSDGAADKIRGSVTFSSSADVSAGVASALAAGGGAAGIDALSQFEWWKSSANKKHDLTYTDDARYGGDILDSSDDADGFRVKQITYPELLHLLDVKDDAKKNFVILFGGTWCHNTRAVLKHVNEEAQANNTTVYNFDLVLDGGTVNGTNGGANPIHVRDNANSGATKDFRPSWVYGDVVRTYFKNLVTQYDPNTGSRVSYYPGGDLTAFPDVVRKLQVPFLINYQRGTNASNPSSTAVKRQWIQQGTDESTGLPTFTEYMTEWWYAKPSAQLGLSFAIPADESTLTDPQKQQLAQARAQVTFARDGLDRLDDFFAGLPGAVVSTQTVTAAPVSYGTTPKVTVAIANKYGRIPAGTVTLSIAGQTYGSSIGQNAASFDVARLAPGSYPFTVGYAGGNEVLPFQQTGTLTVARTSVVEVAGRAVKVPTTKKTGTYKVTVQTPAGLAKATGKVTVTLTKGKVTKKVKGTVKNGVVTVKVPRAAKGTVKVSLAYAGDTSYVPVRKASGTSIKVKK